MNIRQLQIAVNEYTQDCADFITQSPSLHFGEDGYVSFQDRSGAYTRGILNEWARQQVGQKLDAPPSRWLNDGEHCSDDLRTVILNTLAQTRDSMGLTMRMKGDTVRAVLSDQYTPFDNKELVDLMGEAIETMGTQAQIHRPEIGDDLRGYVLLPSISFGKDPRDDKGYGNGGLHPAIYFSNSERGGGSVRLTGAVYRSVCSNGAIYGWQKEEVFTLRHRWIQRSTLRLLVAEAMTSALKMSEEAAKKFVAAQEVHLKPSGLKSLVSEWAGKYGLAVSTQDNWLAEITSESVSYGRQHDPRLFDVVNAATFLAQSYQGGERETIERMAGDLLRVRR